MVAALAPLVAVGCGSSSGAASRVGVFPMAGTPTASARTQVSFRGASVDQLTEVTVVGSKSGDHKGTLKPHSDGNGASFVPLKRFSDGETVKVKANRPLAGQRNGAVSFRIASPASIGVPGHVQGDPAGDPKGTQRFHSRTDLRPPSIKILKKTSKTAPGDLFLAPKAGPGQDGTMIVDGNGKLVWYRRVPKLTSPLDFRVQEYGGKPVLTWWEGGVHHGQGQGEGVMLDSSYGKETRVRAGNGYQADFHEFQLSREGTAFLLIYQPVRADLRAVGGPKNGSALDGIVQEIDIKTGLVLFEWHSIGSVRSTESYARPSKKEPFDISHVNSVFEEKNGNLLVSARDLNSALELDRATGRLRWRLGGKKSDFKMNGGSQFVSAHSIRRLPDGRLTVFDNGAPPYPGRAARAIALSVKGGGKNTVSLSRSLKRSSGLRSPSQGNVQGLPNGNLMVGWGGSTPFFTEFTSSGTIALDAKIDPALDTYRVWRFPWHAQPARAPDVVAEKSSGKTKVFASWNGATEVARWEILAGGSPSSLVSITRVPRSGFETSATINGSPKFVVARALGKNGAVLDSSDPVTPG